MKPRRPSYKELEAKLREAETLIKSGKVIILPEGKEPLDVQIKSVRKEKERLSSKYERVLKEWEKTFHSINSKIWILDREQRIVRSNNVSLRGLDLDEKKSTGMHCYELVHCTLCPIPECPLTRARMTLMRESMEMKINGYWFEVIVDPIMDEKGDYNGCVHIINDITDRKQDFEKLQESEERFLRLFNSSEDAIMLLDRVFVDANEAALKLFGYSRKDEITGKHPASLSPPVQADGKDSQGKANRMIRQASRKGYNRFEWIHRRANGEDFIAEVSLTPIIYQGKNLLYCILRDITAHKRANEELRSSKSYLQAVFDSVNDALFVDDADTGRIIDVNRRCCEMYGYSYEEMLRTPIGDLSLGQPPYSQAEALEWLRKTREEGPQVFEWLARKKDSTLFWVEVSSHFVKIGGLNRFVVAVRDIDERKRIQEALRISEERLNHAMAVANDGLWDWNLLTDEVYYDPRYYQMAGYEVNEFPHKLEEFQKRIYPDDRDYVKAEVQKHLEEKTEKFEVEFRFLRKDGSYMWIQGKGKIVKRDSNGKPLRFVGTHFDITEHKQAEVALRESRNLLHTILNTIPVRVFWKDKNLNYLGCNMPFANDAGLSSPEEIVGKNDFQMEWLEQAELYRSDDRKVIVTGTAKLNYEEPQTTHDGSTIWLKTSKVPLRDPDGTIISVLGTYEDITERKKNEEELIKAKEKAEENDRLKSAFLANMSHEIRTPMNGIIGFLELLKVPDLSEETKNEYIEIINRSGQRLLNTINNIIEISKIDAGLINIQKTRFSITELLKDLTDFFRKEASEKGLILKIRLPGHYIEIESDRAKVESIFTNLIKNAIKFTCKGEINISLEHTGGKLTICVSDTGRGIPEEKLEKIFDRFVQGDTDLTRPYEGSGLGLSIAREYVKLLKGNITVKSEINKGSTFCVEFPEDGLKISLPEKDKTRTSGVTLPDNIKKKTVLIVEDDEASFQYLKILLEAENFKIYRACEGREAVRLATEKDIDLVLMDAKIPVMDGYEATREILKIKPGLPVIMQTAYAFQGDRDKAFSAGCVDYISKPFSGHDLWKMILKYLK